MGQAGGLGQLEVDLADEGAHLPGDHRQLGGRMHQARGARRDGSASSTAATAASKAPSGSGSPNQTTPGRTNPCARTGHRGGATRRAGRPLAAAAAATTSPESYGAPHSEHRKATMLPCRWTTSALPARSCRSSTF